MDPFPSPSRSNAVAKAKRGSLCTISREEAAMSAQPEEVRNAGIDPGSPSAPSSDGEVPTKDEILEALKEVHDPELGVNIVDLGLVYEVDIDPEQGRVHVTYTLTTMGCPIGPMVEAQMNQLLSGFAGIQHVECEMVLRPPWTPEMMSEEAKAALGYF
jgi:metal-sulfur cluster biosynthetic enzyme